MRALDMNQLFAVAGGRTIGEGLALAGAIGRGYGASIALSSGGGFSGIAATSGTTAIMGVAGSAAAGVVGAGIAGWEIGGMISGALPNSVNDAIGAGIANVIDRLGGMFSDGAGSMGSGGRSPFMCYSDDLEYLSAQ